MVRELSDLERQVLGPELARRAEALRTLAEATERIQRILLLMSGGRPARLDPERMTIEISEQGE